MPFTRMWMVGTIKGMYRILMVTGVRVERKTRRMRMGMLLVGRWRIALPTVYTPSSPFDILFAVIEHHRSRIDVHLFIVPERISLYP